MHFKGDFVTADFGKGADGPLYVPKMVAQWLDRKYFTPYTYSHVLYEYCIV